MENTVASFQELSKLPNDAPYYFRGVRSYTTGWKMHLFLNNAPDKFPDLHNETVTQLSEFLINENLEHKFKNGCDGANTFCIYVGSRDDCENLAQRLIKLFGEKFQKLSPTGNDFSGSDKNLFNHPNIGIRFDGVNEKKNDSPFLRYGENGIPGFLYGINFASAVLGRKISDEQEDKLKKIACHLILAKYCGEKYLGKNYSQHPWDQEVFDAGSMFSVSDIETYTQKCIALFDPVKFIKPASLAEKGYDINVDEKIKSTKLLNRLSLKNHGFYISNADNVVLSETHDKQGKELAWNKDNKLLAKYTAMKDGYSFVTLYGNDGKEDKFLLMDNVVYLVHSGKAEKINSAFLSAKIKNIAEESLVLKSRIENFSINTKFPKVR